MLLTGGNIIIRINVNSVLAKFFLILLVTQRTLTQSSIEGYVEAYRMPSEKGETIAEPNKTDQDGHHQDYYDDYVYKDEPEIEAGVLDPEVEHILY